MRRDSSCVLATALTLTISTVAEGQTAPGASPPPPYPPPSHGYPPPYGYGYPPPAYGYPPPGYGPPPHPYAVQPAGPPGASGASRAEGPTSESEPAAKTSSSSELFVVGVVGFALSYGVSAAIGASVEIGGEKVFAPLLIPVAGPVINIGTIASRDDDKVKIDGQGASLLILDTLIQAGSLGAIVVALAGKSGSTKKPLAHAPQIWFGPRSASARFAF